MAATNHYIPIQRVKLPDLKLEIPAASFAGSSSETRSTTTDGQAATRPMRRSTKTCWKAGSLDQTFFIDARFVLVPQADALKIAYEWVWGSEKPSQFFKSLKELASQYLSADGQEALSAWVEWFEPHVAVAGIFGDPEEIEGSGLEEVRALTSDDLQQARKLYQFGVAMADCAARGGEFLPPNVFPALNQALYKIANTLAESDEWYVAGLAACAIAVSRVKR